MKKKGKLRVCKRVLAFCIAVLLTVNVISPWGFNMLQVNAEVGEGDDNAVSPSTEEGVVQQGTISNFHISLNQDNKSLDLSWDEIANAEDYDLYIYNSNKAGSKYEKLESADMTSYTLTSSKSINYRTTTATYGIAAFVKGTTENTDSLEFYQTQEWQAMYLVTVNYSRHGMITYQEKNYRTTNLDGDSFSFYATAAEEGVDNVSLKLTADEGYDELGLTADGNDCTDSVVDGIFAARVTADTDLDITFSYRGEPDAPVIEAESLAFEDGSGNTYQPESYTAKNVTLTYQKSATDLKSYDGMEIGYKTAEGGKTIWNTMSGSEQEGYKWTFAGAGKYEDLQLRWYITLDNGNGKKYSKIATIQDTWIGIDAAVPDISMSLTSADGSIQDGWSDGAVTVKLESKKTLLSGIKSFYYYVSDIQIDTGAVPSDGWVAYDENQIPLDCPENQNKIYYVYGKAQSGAGVDSTVVMQEVKIDKTTPDSWTYAEENPFHSAEHEWYTQSNKLVIFLSGVSDDGGSKLTTYYTLEKDGVQKAKDTVYSSKGISLTASGKYKLTYYTLDAVGHSSQTVSKEIWVDATAPKVTLTGIENGIVSNQTQTLKLLVEEEYYDMAGVSIEVSRTKDGKTTSYPVTPVVSDQASSSQTYTFSEEGTYTVHVYVADKAGNRSTTESITFQIDKTAPKNVAVTANVKENSKHWYKEYPTISVDDSTMKNDLGSPVILYYVLHQKSDSVKENDYLVWKNSSKLTISKDGIWELNYYTVDAVGNKSKTESQVYQVDTENPTEPVITFSTKNTSALAHFIHYISFGYFCNEEIQVTLSGSDSLSGVQNITYWTTEDGVESKKITSQGDSKTFSLSLDFKGKVSAYVTDMAGNSSSTSVSDGVIYENLAAEITITADKDNAIWQNGDIKFHVTTQDKNSGLKSVEYKLDGNVVYEKDYTGEKDITYSDVYDVVATEEAVTSGGYTLEVTVVDNAGNAVTKSERAYIDKTAPKIALSGIENNSYSNQTETVKVSVNEQIFDKNTVKIEATRTLDGVTSNYDLESYISDGIDSSKNYSFGEDGCYTMTVSSVDAAGNAAVTETLTFTIDKTAPVISISGIPADSYNGTDVSVDVSVLESFFDTDKVSINVTKTIDGTSSSYDFGSWNNTGKETLLPHTFQEDGTYLIEVEATDAAGNAAAKQQLSFTVDKTAPEVAILGADDYYISGNSITLSYDVTESYFDTNDVSILVQKEDVNGTITNVDVGSWKNTAKDSSLNYELSEDGIYTSTITAVDKAGNEATIKKTVTIDTTNPVIRYVDELNGNYLKSFQLDHDISEMIEDLTIPIYTMYLNSDKYDGVSEITEEGKYVFQMDVSDEVGHTAVAQAEFVIDHTEPTVVITGASDGDVLQDSADLSIALSDQEDSIQSIVIDEKEQSFDTKSNTYSASVEQIGKHTVAVTATDYAGNDTTKKIEFEIAKKGILSSVITGVSNHSGLAVAGGVIVVAGAGTGVAFATGAFGGTGAAKAAAGAGKAVAGNGKIRRLFRKRG